MVFLNYSNGWSCFHLRKQVVPWVFCSITIEIYLEAVGASLFASSIQFSATWKVSFSPPPFFKWLLLFDIQNGQLAVDCKYNYQKLVPSFLLFPTENQLNCILRCWVFGSKISWPSKKKKSSGGFILCVSCGILFMIQRVKTYLRPEEWPIKINIMTDVAFLWNGKC